MTLFDHHRQEIARRTAPLATRMRPRILEEFVGQEHIVGPDGPLRLAVESNRIPSMVLWGPPGSGKTTLARLIASLTQAHFETLSAVSSGVGDVRKVIDEARGRLGQESRQTILFIDEIHRFNKSQQDALLPHIEEGTITLIGATTENPSFEVIGPLLSRCRVYTLQPLTDEQVGLLVDRALADKERGLGDQIIRVDDDARRTLLTVANGDARVALDALELSVWSVARDDQGCRSVTATTVGNAVQRKARYDKAGDAHYDTISAFIKCVRGSDPDAAVYWLARMIDAGEDPVFIARRLVILAAEDIGLADPGALNFAVACQQGVHLIGYPEARILLAEAAIYLAGAPKSNSAYAAINSALHDVQSTRNEPVPLHLRNPQTRLMRELGYGRDYRYAHDYEGAFAPMDNLPENVKGRRYYFPSDIGYEPRIRERLERWWQRSFEGRSRTPPPESEGGSE